MIAPLPESTDYGILKLISKNEERDSEMVTFLHLSKSVSHLSSVFCLLSRPLLSSPPDSYTLSSSLSFDIARPHAAPSSPNEAAKWF